MQFVEPIRDKKKIELVKVILKKSRFRNYHKSYDISFDPTKYYDANGNEISTEEWYKLEP